MKIKKFLVQIEADGKTHWLADDELLRQALAFAVGRIIKANTRGEVPRVNVIQEERRES